MAATSARVAPARESIIPLSLPIIRPHPTAHSMFSLAQPEISASSVNLERSPYFSAAVPLRAGVSLSITSASSL